jgi:hypothetical protein
MSRWAAARRRRRLERQLKALDREYAAWATGPRKVRRERRGDPTAWLSLVAAVAGVLAVVVAFPSLVPASVRNVIGLGPERVVDAPSASGSGSYAFIAHQPGDRTAPVGYDPCHPVDVRINPDGAPPGSVTLVRDAMAEVSDLTGLALRYVGPSDERPQWESATVPRLFGRVRTKPVLVSWATASEVPQLAGDVAGIGGSVSVDEQDGVTRFVTGGVTLDADDFATIAEQSDGTEQMRAIILHELGHVVGLAHVKDSHELMNADNLGLTDFGVGDRLGLAAVGSGSCA